MSSLEGYHQNKVKSNYMNKQMGEHLHRINLAPSSSKTVGTLTFMAVLKAIMAVFKAFLAVNGKNGFDISCSILCTACAQLFWTNGSINHWHWFWSESVSEARSKAGSGSESRSGSECGFRSESRSELWLCTGKCNAHAYRNDGLNWVILEMCM